MSTESTRTAIQMRVDPDIRSLIDRAAELSGVNRTQFMLSAAIRNAKDTIMDQRELYVDPDVFHQVCDLLDNDEEPSPALVELMTATRPW